MTRRLRVLLLCDRLDIAGGVERFVCAMANHLDRQGMDVAVGSVDTPRERVSYVLEPSVRVVHGTAALAALGEGGSRLGRARQLLQRQWHIGRALARLIRDERPDVVVLNGLTTACSTLLADASFAARTICCDHNHFDARSGLWRWLRAKLYPKVAAVVSLTQADAPRFRALNRHTEVIYNASTLRADEPAAVAAPIVLAVGRHVAQKGFDLLVRAWQVVSAELPDARLRIVGDGPLREETRALARELGVDDRIEWVDPTPRIEQHFRDAAVFVLPSRYEGMPLALLEAQALGVPSVAFDCPTGPAEILSGDTGRLVPPGDFDALAKAMVELLGSVTLRQQMARAAIARSLEVFSPERHFAQWVALVQRVGSGRVETVA